MIDKDLAIPVRGLEDYLGDKFDSAWMVIKGARDIDRAVGIEPEWDNIVTDIHLDRYFVPHVAFRKESRKSNNNE